MNNHQKCVRCTYSANPASANNCTVCGTSLKVNYFHLSNYLDLFFKKQIFNPSIMGGIGILSLSIYLWINYFLTLTKDYNSSSLKIESAQLIKQVKNVPTGVFSYGGEGYFASLLAHGLQQEIQKYFPNFESHYTLPINQDSSYSAAIKMLLEGEVDFVFNGRPLKSSEYAQAKLQNITIQQIPIALDGIVFFSNQNLSVSQLRVDQLQNIFQGKITNWKQLGGKDLPITPIILAEENLTSLGFEINPQANHIQYVANQTLANRAVIQTPGAISYASATLVQNQSLLNVFALGQLKDSHPEFVNYVHPFASKNNPNKQAFLEGSYPLVRRLFLVISKRPRSYVSGIAFANFLLSNQGQLIIDKSGFIPLYNQKNE